MRSRRQLFAYLGVWLLSIIVVTLAQESRIQTKVEREVRKEVVTLTPCLEDNKASELACDKLARRISPRVVRLLTNRQVREIGRRVSAQGVRRVIRRELRRREQSRNRERLRSGKEPPDKTPSGKPTGARKDTASGGTPVKEPEETCSGPCLLERLQGTVQALIPAGIMPLLGSVEPTL